MIVSSPIVEGSVEGDTRVACGFWDGAGGGADGAGVSSELTPRSADVVVSSLPSPEPRSEGGSVEIPWPSLDGAGVDMLTTKDASADPDAMYWPVVAVVEEDVPLRSAVAVCEVLADPQAIDGEGGAVEAPPRMAVAVHEPLAELTS